MTPVSALLIFVALILYILGQLFLKHAMEDDLGSARFKKNFAVGLSTMFTRLSVHCALKMVAIKSCNGFPKSSSQCASG